MPVHLVNFIEKEGNLVTSETRETQHQGKKPYSTPELTVHGSVEAITQAVAGSVTDLVNGSQVK